MLYKAALSVLLVLSALFAMNEAACNLVGVSIYLIRINTTSVPSLQQDIVHANRKSSQNSFATLFDSQQPVNVTTELPIGALLKLARLSPDVLMVGCV